MQQAMSDSRSAPRRRQGSARSPVTVKDEGSCQVPTAVALDQRTVGRGPRLVADHRTTALLTRRVRLGDPALRPGGHYLDTPEAGHVTCPVTMEDSEHEFEPRSDRAHGGGP